MIAVDTNILVYAHRKDSQFHEAADRELTNLAEGDRLWSIPWPCIHEFLAIVTHPRIYHPPTPAGDALMQVGCWMECPRLQLIGETGDYWNGLKDLVLKGRLSGPKIHDARVAAICLQNGVKILWSADRDFSRVKEIEIVNPL